MKQHLLNNYEMQCVCVPEKAELSLLNDIRQRGVSANPEQIAAISHESGPLMCLAGPGSGKTFVLTWHIRYLIIEKKIDPYRILVLTFSKASAFEMQKRFFTLMGQEYFPVRFGTFHAIFFQLLSQYEHYKTSDILTISQKKKYLKSILLQIKYQGKFDTESMETILSRISYIKNHNQDCEINRHSTRIQNAFVCTNGASFVEKIETEIPQFCEIYEKYENLLRQEHKLDFDDMMILCQRLLKQRPDILDEYRKEIQYVLIDEYQDINSVQYELIKELIKPHQNMFVVGDDDQAIYGFRGCNPSIMLAFKNDFPNGRIITFPINYRCNQEIVDAAGCVISNNSNRFGKKIMAYKSYKKESAVLFQNFESKEKEYEYLIDELKKICRMDSKNDLPKENPTIKQNNSFNSNCTCACLFRTNMEASYLAEILLKEKIPYQMKEKPYNPYEHFISRDFLHYLHIKEGDMSLEEFVPIMNRPLRYISRDAINTIGIGKETEKDFDYWRSDIIGENTTIRKVDLQELKRFYAQKEYMLKNIGKLEYDIKRMQKMDIFAALNYIRKGIGYDDFLKKQAIEQNVSVEEYMKIADEIQKRMGMFSSLEQLENHIENYRELAGNAEGIYRGVVKGQESTMYSGQNNKNDEKRKVDEEYSIQIMTYHASKGLEFDTVFLPDCNEGNIPYRKSVLPEQIEEERRLFYVAMTRAKEKLHILYLDGDKHNRHLVSRFVKEAKRGMLCGMNR